MIISIITVIIILSEKKYTPKKSYSSATAKKGA
jgi:hypothetical protein